jgi:hypothetical protein
VDPLTAPWVEIEKPVIGLLGGAFSTTNEAHMSLVFMLAAALAERLRRELGAFWFRNRGTAEGAALGFPTGGIVFSPFGAVVQALSRSQLSMLEAATGELRQAMAQAKGMAPGGQPAALGPDDYQRLFDPGFIQFLRLDGKALGEALAATPAALARELDDAFGRLPDKVPPEVREGMRKQLTGALRRLDPARPLSEQADRSPQLPEMMGLLRATVDGSGFAPVELWEEVLLPLLHIGAAEKFPELDDEEKEAFKQTDEPVLLYVDALPFQVPAEDEDGLLGVFPPEDVSAIHPGLGRSTGRLLQVDPAALEAPLARFDVNALGDAVVRFVAHAAAAGASVAETRRPPNTPSMLDIALTLLDDLQRVFSGVKDKPGSILALRQVTESEAQSEPMLGEVRRALTGRRIILP